MPLEPWEIELRNQLGGGLQEKPEPTGEDNKPAEPELAPQIPDPAPVQTQPPPSGSSAKQSSTSSFLAALIFLTVVTLFAYDYKNGSKIKNKISGLFSTRPESPQRKKAEPKREEPTAPPAKPQPEAKPQPKPEAPQPKAEEKKGDLEALRAENKAQIEALNKRLDSAANKLKLIGLLLNENFNIIGQQINDSFIYLNNDWTLDRMPKYLELSPEDRQYLEQYVRQTSKASKP